MARKEEARAPLLLPLLLLLLLLLPLLLQPLPLLLPLLLLGRSRFVRARCAHAVLALSVCVFACADARSVDLHLMHRGVRECVCACLRAHI